MKKLFRILVGILILIAILYSQKQKLSKWILLPEKPFKPLDSATAPDYALDSSWLALPTKKDNADIVGIDDIDRQLNSKADVFFIHPTTYFGNSSWNDPLDGTGHLFPKSNTLKVNASVFNSCCDIYAPVFRQATMWSYGDYESNEMPAITFGSTDVIRAFDYYLEHYNKGRPIIIASHSQGADHGLILLKERFSGQANLSKLVAAYLIGRPIGRERLGSYLPDIPECNSASQTGCIIGYMTIGENFNFEKLKSHASSLSDSGMLTVYDSKDTICTNPLSWTADGSKEEADKHLGFYKWVDNTVVLQEQKVSAKCDRGALVIEPGFFEIFVNGGYYHIYDYGLFYKNIRRNTVDRVEQFVKASIPENN